MSPAFTTMVCTVCDRGHSVRAELARDTGRPPHCPDCGSMLRAAPQQWGVGEIGHDTADLMALIDSDEQLEAVGG